MRVNSNLRLLLLGATSLLVGCSTTNNTVASCGPGTTLQDGVCVVADGGISGDTSSADSAPDGTTPPDSSVTETVVAIDTGGSETTLDAASGDDPCPPALYVNCSSSCGGPSDNCGDTTCTGNSDPASPALIVTWVRLFCRGVKWREFGRFEEFSMCA